ncbi:MAG TPA: DinB family protein [Gemmatimonadaceae bacterium]|nr:DinB family protein [Gemmatimonadaceae bacterium]
MFSLRFASRGVAVMAALAAAVPVAGAQQAASAPTPLQNEVIADISAIEQKYIQLAEAIPQEKFSWRPGEGVRSISEVFGHVAGSNYFLVRVGGLRQMTDIPAVDSIRGMEKLTDKARLIEVMRRSFNDARRSVAATPAADLDKPIKMFGQDMTVRSAMLLLDNHLHEHLGQAIAYARSNNVVPPWSASGGGN